MNFLKKIKNIYQSKIMYQQKNKKIEKLTKWSIFFILVLDIFVYSTIQMGISFQTSILNNPNTIIDYKCRNIINEDIITYNNYQYFKNNYTQFKYTKYNNVLKKIAYKQLDKRCLNIKNSMRNIFKNNKINNIKNNIQNLNIELNKITQKLNYIKTNYNTVLFEKIANQSKDNSILKMNLETTNIKNKYNILKNKKDYIIKQINNNEKYFKNNYIIKDLNQYIKENRKSILKDYTKLKRGYYLKKNGIILLFLIPLLILFYWRIKLNNINSNYTRYMIAKNIFFIVFIILIINIISIIYSYIPHIFLTKILNFFYNLHIPFVAYYLLLGIGILIFSLIIIKIQNRSKKKTDISFIQKYERKKCSKCGISIDYMNMNFCPNCNNILKRKCKNCNQWTINEFDVCMSCGVKK